MCSWRKTTQLSVATNQGQSDITVEYPDRPVSRCPFGIPRVDVPYRRRRLPISMLPISRFSLSHDWPTAIGTHLFHSETTKSGYCDVRSR